MPPKQYLDENGNPVKTYLDDNGNPIQAAPNAGLSGPAQPAPMEGSALGKAVPAGQAVQGVGNAIAQGAIGSAKAVNDAALGTTRLMGSAMRAVGITGAGSPADQVNTTPQGIAQKVGYGAGIAGQLAMPGEAAANALPSTQRAGSLFQSIKAVADKAPVELENAGDSALKLMDWQKKTQLGPTVNKFLNRITNPNLGELTYGEARDYYQLLGRLSVEESSRLAPAVKRDLVQMVVGLRQDVGNAAGKVGRLSDYNQAMAEYAKAAKIKELAGDAGAYAWEQVKQKAPWLITIYGGKRVYDALR